MRQHLWRYQDIECILSCGMFAAIRESCTVAINDNVCNSSEAHKSLQIVVVSSRSVSLHGGILRFAVTVKNIYTQADTAANVCTFPTSKLQKMLKTCHATIESIEWNPEYALRTPSTRDNEGFLTLNKPRHVCQHSLVATQAHLRIPTSLKHSQVRHQRCERVGRHFWGRCGESCQ